tara:strand:- start:332 stop:1423 length:1092 start_codon:yes stop_codon:yes gene_type:complete
LLKTFINYFLFIFLFFGKTLSGNECESDSSLKIGLIDNKYINYEYFLYYELGNFAVDKNLEFEIQKVDNNVDKFDIIFGEYYDLIKLSQNKVNYPSLIVDFYSENNIQLSNNLFPLDLDTFILTSKNNEKRISDLEELSKYFDTNKYTLGINFKIQNEVSKILSYNSGYTEFNLESIENEMLLNIFGKTYKNINKNILSSDFLDTYSSYENNENVFTLFNDGILLNKNFKYQTYQLFPQSKYKWNKDEGIFFETLETIPYSYYGFSAYLNNSNEFGFLCHLIKNDVRTNSFKNFNIALSPLSANEVKSYEQLPEGYIEILNSKNQNILDIDYKNFSQEFETIKSIVLGNQNYQNSIETDDYLN